MNLNGTEYYYVKNAQGDIIGLIDKSRATVASYTYDSWGKLISIKDGSGNDIANNTSGVGYKNHYRYISYRYDTETGLYYLERRYYNPEWGRFINADALGGSIGELLSHNVFAYCKDNCVNRYDCDGYSDDPNAGGGGGALLFGDLEGWLDIGEDLQSYEDSFTVEAEVNEEINVEREEHIEQAKGAGNAIEDLSSKALKHPLNDHMVSRYVQQIPYQSKEAVEEYLSKRSFFNPDWTEEQVTNALNSAYKDAVNNGITNGYHTYKIYGEEINVFMRDGKFSTGFGNYKFAYDEIMNFVK